MTKTKRLVEEALSLPVEERAIIADSLHKNLALPATCQEAPEVFLCN